MGEDRTTAGMVRYTVAEAADMLGITTGAVRNRLSRKTLSSTKEDGTVYVLLPADMSRNTERDADDIPPGMPPSDSNVLTSELRDRLRYVEEQLQAERQAHAEARRLLAAALERIPAIEPAASQEPRESPERRPGTVDPQEPAAGPPTATQPQERVPWWRRMFGG